MTAAFLVLHGHCPGKKNLWKRGRGGRTYIDSETKALIDALTLQAQNQWRGEPVTHPDMRVRFYTRDRRRDRDNMLTTILDCLREAGVIVNDNIAQFNGTLSLLPAVIDENERVTIVTFRQACVGRESSGQLPKEEANSHGDITVHLCLPGWSRHQMAATLAFVEGHSPDMNLLAFQRAGEVNGIGRDSPHQIRSLTHLAGCRFTRACFSTHHRPPVHWGDHATLATAAASSSVAR